MLGALGLGLFLVSPVVPKSSLVPSCSANQPNRFAGSAASVLSKQCLANSGRTWAPLLEKQMLLLATEPCAPGGLWWACWGLGKGGRSRTRSSWEQGRERGAAREESR